MEKIEWNDDLSIGDELIDEQHKALIKRLNDVARAMEEQQGEREITRTLEFLSDYTCFHFAAEEKQMELAGYPGLEIQKRNHSEFLKTLKNLENDFYEEGATRPLAESINTFLFNWLTKHIKGLDREFAVFLSDITEGNRG
ncbi:MAG: bacteriohemerythrin [Kiritimatiellales bacterium]|nr:bacteriohemerythrin [Kiritimatiellales bacterium]